MALVGDCALQMLESGKSRPGLIHLVLTVLAGPHPQYGWDFPEEIPEKFRKDPGNALRAFPGIPLESTAGDAPNPIIQGI